MDTSKFKTKTEIIFRNNGSTNKAFGIALDVGYSAVKLFGPSIIARFPSYAKRISKDFSFLTSVDESTIIYTDNVTGDRWLVGEAAQEQIKVSDTSDSEAALYGRERYGTPMFRVIARCGMGLAMINDEFKNTFADSRKELTVQTGLPEKYLGMDKEWFVDSLSGEHNFTLQVGNNTVNFSFNLSPKNVFVMSQPKGTLFSVCTERNGSWYKDAMKYMKSSVLVFDPGFGTLDIFPINNGAVTGTGETFPELGMKRVMQETVSRIKEEYGLEISVPAMQKYLATGVYKYVDRRTLKPKIVDFSDILKECNEKVCNEAIERMLDVFDLNDYQYLIITGGTGAAWLSLIRERFEAAIEENVITIINGNQNDVLSFVYSNVRGYYNYLYRRLAKQYGRA